MPERAGRQTKASWAANRAEATKAVTHESAASLGVARTPAASREQIDAVATVAVLAGPLGTAPHGTAKDIKERSFEALSPDNQ